MYPFHVINVENSFLYYLENFQTLIFLIRRQRIMEYFPKIYVYIPLRNIEMLIVSKLRAARSKIRLSFVSSQPQRPNFSTLFGYFKSIVLKGINPRFPDYRKQDGNIKKKITSYPNDDLVMCDVDLQMRQSDE